MHENINNKQLRAFGLLVGCVFALLGFWPLLFGKEMRLWAVVPAGALIFLAVIAPALLGHVHRLWMKIGHFLGLINTRIILSVVFYGLFVPMGFIMRLAGNDPMRRRIDPKADTYRVSSVQRPASHMLRQF